MRQLVVVQLVQAVQRVLEEESLALAREEGLRQPVQELEELVVAWEQPLAVQREPERVQRQLLLQQSTTQRQRQRCRQRQREWR
jgi:hypothetical protein